MVPSISNYWPHHTDLLVFCLKFRLSHVCEYLKYYYKISNDYYDCWAIPEKIQTGGFKENFRFVTLSYGNFGQNKTLPLQIPWNCVTPLGNSNTKNGDLWKFNVIFSWSIPEIPLLFQLTTGISIYIYDIYVYVYIYIKA